MTGFHELERLVVRLVGDGSSYINMINGAVKLTESAATKVKTIGHSFIGIGARLSLGITTPLTTLGGAMLKLAADAETTRLKFETMLGKDKGTLMLNQLRKFAAATPFRFPELAASARTLLSFGVSQKEVMSTLKMLGDVAAGTGKDINELSVIFGQIKGVGRLQGQDFLQLVNAGFPVAEIAKTMGTNMAGLKAKMEKGQVTFENVAETFRRVSSAGGQYNNMMKNLSETFSGRMSSLMDNITMLGQSIGNYLLPIANKMIDWAMAAVEWIDKLGESVHRTALIIGAFAASVGPVLVGIGTSLTLVGGAIFGVGSIVGLVGGIVSSIVPLTTFAVILAVVAKSIQLIVDHFKGAGSFSNIISSSMKSATAATKDWFWKISGFIINIKENLPLLVNWFKENWRNMLTDAVNIVKSFMSNLWHNVASVVSALYTVLKDWFSNNWRVVFISARRIVRLFFINIMHDTRVFLRSLFDAWMTWINRNWTDIATSMTVIYVTIQKNMIHNVMVILNTAFRLFTFTLGAVVDRLESLFSLKIPYLFMKGVLKIVSIMAGLFIAIKNGIEETLKNGTPQSLFDFGNSVGKWANDLGQQIMNDFGSGMESNKDWVFGAAEIIKQQMGELENPFAGILGPIKDIYGTAAQFPNDVMDELRKHAEDIRGVFEGTEEAVSGISDAFAKLPEDVKGAVKKQIDAMHGMLDGFKRTTKDLPGFVYGILKDVEDKSKDANDSIGKALGDAVGKNTPKGLEVSKGEFKQMSLNEFSISPIFNKAKVETQDVSDSGTQQRLDTLIDTVKGQSNAAVLAR